LKYKFQDTSLSILWQRLLRRNPFIFCINGVFIFGMNVVNISKTVYANLAFGNLIIALYKNVYCSSKSLQTSKNSNAKSPLSLVYVFMHPISAFIKPQKEEKVQECDATEAKLKNQKPGAKNFSPSYKHITGA